MSKRETPSTTSSSSFLFLLLLLTPKCSARPPQDPKPMQHYSGQYSMAESSSLLHTRHLLSWVHQVCSRCSGVSVQSVLPFILNQAPSPRCHETSQDCERCSKPHRKLFSDTTNSFLLKVGARKGLAVWNTESSTRDAVASEQTPRVRIPRQPRQCCRGTLRF